MVLGEKSAGGVSELRSVSFTQSPEPFASKSKYHEWLYFIMGIYSSAASGFNCFFIRFATVLSTLLQKFVSKNVRFAAVDAPSTHWRRDCHIDWSKPWFCVGA